MICMFLNEMPSLCTNSNTSDHLSTVVIKFIFQSTHFVLTYVCNMTKFVTKLIFV
jgi:hypothetical protein